MLAVCPDDSWLRSGVMGPTIRGERARQGAVNNVTGSGYPMGWCAYVLTRDNSREEVVWVIKS